MVRFMDAGKQRITREEAIDILKKNYPDSHFKLLREAVDMAIEALKQPERKKGKWIEKTHTYEFFEPIPLCVCSECGRTIKYREKYKYCPNCGAEMEGEE